MILVYFDSGSDELGSENHDRYEGFPGTCVHCKDGILAKCSYCQFLLVGTGDGEIIGSNRHVYVFATMGE